MFCKNCGNQLNDDAKFCDKCGTATDGTVAPATATAAKGPNPMFANFVKGLKAFFSCNVVKGVGAAAKSQTMEWIIFAAANIIAFTISMTLNVLYFVGDIAKFINKLINYGAIIGFNFLIGGVTYFALVGLVFAAVLLLFKKKATFAAVANMVGYATIPITVASIGNILFGLIYSPIAILVFITAIIMSSCLLYIGFQKLDTFEKSPFFGYSLVMFIVVVIAVVLFALMYKGIIEGAVANATSSLLGGLGSMFGGASDVANLF